MDASAVAEVFLRRPAAPELEKRLFGEGETLHAPHLLDIELTQLIRRYALRGIISPALGTRLMTEFAALALVRYPHEPLLPRVWALRHNLSAYDATYVALAELLDVPLITRDQRLAAASGHVARIEVF